MRTVIGVDCASCGLTSGRRESDGAVRCDCGKFAVASNEYCGQHEVNIKNLTGYEDCPACVEERRVKQMEQERMARRSNERMHPSVDAPRY